MSDLGSKAKSWPASLLRPNCSALRIWASSRHQVHYFYHLVSLGEHVGRIGMIPSDTRHNLFPRSAAIVVIPIGRPESREVASLG